MDNSGKIILDLCGGTGSWSRPYREAGYDTPSAAIEKWNRRPASENNPLTLDQLHQMDGELVWIVTKDKCYRLMVTHSDCGMLHLCDSDGRLSVLNESNHGRDWEAFAERPKETPPTDGNL